MSAPVQKILKLVEEGKITAEEAMELMESMGEKPPAPPAEEPAAASESAVPPPPPQAESAPQSAPFGGIVEAIEKIGKELGSGVNWTQVGEQVKSGAAKGAEYLKKAAEQIRDGNFGSLFGESERREVILALPADASKLLKIDNAAGGVKVNTKAAENRVVAKALFRGDNREALKSQADAYQIMVEETDALVWIRQHDLAHVSVEIEIELTEARALEIKTEHGDIAVDGSRGGTKLSCASGAIEVSGAEGSLDLHAASGDLTVRDSQLTLLNMETKSGLTELTRVRAATTIRTASGDVYLRECSGQTISAEAVSGDVILDLDHPVEGVVNVRTVSGKIELGIADGGNCRVSLSAIRGDTIATVDLKDPVRSQGRITGTLGEGAGSIDLSAVSGDIVLRMRDHTL